MAKALAIITPRKDLKIVVQTRILKTTCNTIDQFAEEKGMSRAECIEHLLRQSAEWIRQGHIK